MNPPAIAVVSSTLVAIAFFLDIAQARRHSQIYDRFLKWWIWLADLNLKRAVGRSIKITNRVIDILCGPKIFSARALVVTAAMIFSITVGRFWLLETTVESIQTRVLGTSILSLPVIIPGVVIFSFTRWLLRAANHKQSGLRLATLALVNLLMVQLILMGIAFGYGAAVQRWIESAFIHRLNTNDVEAVLSAGYAFYFAYLRIYGYIAFLPAIAFALLCLWWVLVYFASGVCFMIGEFFRLEIERNNSRPFASLALAICMAITLIFPASRALRTSKLHAQFESLEHRLIDASSNTARHAVVSNASVFREGTEFALFDLELSAFLAVTEFIGPNPNAIKQMPAALSRIRRDWSKSPRSQPNQ
jgi:hypothetical protein